MLSISKCRSRIIWTCCNYTLQGFFVISPNARNDYAGIMTTVMNAFSTYSEADNSVVCDSMS